MTDPIKLDPEKTAQIDATAAQIRDLLAKRPPPCAETRRQAATVVAAALASATGAAPATPPPPVHPAPFVGKMAFLLGAGLLAAGCANPLDPALRRTMEAIERNWPKIRDKSAPAPGVDATSYERATAAMDRAVAEGGEAARAE